MGLLGILLGLSLLVWLSYRGYSVLLLAPIAAAIAALCSGEPVLAHWTITFMGSAAGFVAQFFPLFLLGAVFGKLMDDAGSVQTIAAFLTDTLGPRRAILAVVLAGALVTYGGVSLFVSFFVLAPMAQALFRAADVPARLMPAAIALGTSTFTMSALPGTPAIQNAIPMPVFGTTSFAAPGLGVIAALIMGGFGLVWLQQAEARARRRGEGYAAPAGDTAALAADDPVVRERATTSGAFDPAEMAHGEAGAGRPSVAVALLPMALVVAVNLAVTLWVLPRLDTGYLATPRFGGITVQSLAGVWSVIVALCAAIVLQIALNRGRLPDLRATLGAGANAAVLPVLSVASLVGFGAVVAAMPAFDVVRDAVLGIGGNPLVSLAVSTNLLAALTGSASGGLTIALDALGPTYLQIAEVARIDPALMHRVAVIGAGTLDTLPHNGAVVTLLAVCGCTHRQSYRDIVMVAIVGAVLALAAVIVLGSVFGSF